ncbi:MAG: hypothetical protein JWR74_2470 [Polaromonas sp.]|nr:hypothetical protein [Polaromonas sp.]
MVGVELSALLHWRTEKLVPNPKGKCQRGRRNRLSGARFQARRHFW